MTWQVVNWARGIQLPGPASRKTILLLLADHANTVWELWAGQETLAAESGWSTRTVRRALDDLEALGVIEREERRRPDGYRAADLIRLCRDWTPDPQVSPDSESPDNDPSAVDISPDNVSDLTGQPDRSHRTQWPREEEPPEEPPENQPLCLTTADNPRSRAVPPPVDNSVGVACALLAQRTLAALLAEHGDPFVVTDLADWLIAETDRRRRVDGRRLAELAELDPDATPEQLADAIEAADVPPVLHLVPPPAAGPDRPVLGPPHPLERRARLRAAGGAGA